MPDDPTIDEIKAALLANAGYRAAGSVAMAAAFETACIRYSSTLPSMVRQGNRHEVQTDVRHYLDLADRARAWINSQSAAGSVSHADLRSLR